MLLLVLVLVLLLFWLPAAVPRSTHRSVAISEPGSCQDFKVWFRVHGFSTGWTVLATSFVVRSSF